MRAVRFHNHGGSDVLQLEHDVPEPVPTPSQIVVELEYAGVNFVDVYLRDGLYPTKLPCIAGREGAGIVTAIGSEVSPSLNLKLGDKVAIFDQGTLAERTATDPAKVLRLPDSVSTKVGAAIMLQGLTAWTLTRDAHDVKPGEWVLVQAAAGGTGGLLSQMCAALGANVIGTASTPEKAAVARENGCLHVINYKEQDIVEEVTRLTDGRGCHVVYSGVGRATFDADMACVRRNGTMCTYGNSSGAVDAIKPLALSKKNVKLVRPTLANYIADADEFATRSRELLGLLAEGKVKPRFGGEYGLDQVGQAQDDLTGARTMGKLVVKIK